MKRRAKKKRDRSGPKRRAPEPPTVGLLVNGMPPTEVVQRAKRLEATLAKWLKANPANADRFAKDPARVISKLDPSVLRQGLKIDRDAVAGILKAQADLRYTPVGEDRRLFEAWWSWVNASSSHSSAYRTNPVGTVLTATAGLNFHSHDEDRLMAAVAYVTGSHFPGYRLKGEFGALTAAVALFQQHTPALRRVEGARP